MLATCGDAGVIDAFISALVCSGVADADAGGANLVGAALPGVLTTACRAIVIVDSYAVILASVVDVSVVSRGNAVSAFENLI